MILQNPSRQYFKGDLPENRREMNVPHSNGFRIHPLQDFSGVLVIRSVANDELEFIARRQSAKILEVILLSLAAGRAFYIHDADTPRVYYAYVDAAISLHQDRMAC